MKRGPSMQVEQSSEPLGLEAMREALDREEKYLIDHIDAECGIMPGDIEGAFHRIREAALAALQLPEAEIQEAPVMKRENTGCKCHGETFCPDLVFSHWDDDQPVFREKTPAPPEANSTAAPVDAPFIVAWLRSGTPFQGHGRHRELCNQAADAIVSPAPVDAGVREAGVDWPVYGDGEAPWSEDEQFDEQRKACKARTKQFGECGGEGDYEGQCDDCGYDAQDALRKKYRPALASSQPVVGVDQTHPSFNDAIEAAAKIVDEPLNGIEINRFIADGKVMTDRYGRELFITKENVEHILAAISSAIRSLKLPDYRGGDSKKTAESGHSPSTREG